MPKSATYKSDHIVRFLFYLFPLNSLFSLEACVDLWDGVVVLCEVKVGRNRCTCSREPITALHDVPRTQSKLLCKLANTKSCSTSALCLALVGEGAEVNLAGLFKNEVHIAVLARSYSLRPIRCHVQISQTLWRRGTHVTDDGLAAFPISAADVTHDPVAPLAVSRIRT